jgi:carboxyl-terminal processing protease
MRLVHLFLILFSFCTVVTESAETCQQPSMLIRFMQRYHFSPRELNSASENNVFELFISSLDPDRLLFTSSDVDSLKKYVPGILDTNRQVSCLFVSKSGEVYRRRLIECDSIFASALKNEFQFLATDTLYFRKERKYQFASGRKEIDARRMKSLKYDFLSDLFDQADDSLTPAMINSLVKGREKEFRERVVSAERCELQQRMNPTGGFEKAVMNNFLNAIAHLYDPHSDYFSMEENNSFTTSLSVEAQSCWFKLNDEYGKIKINKLVAGGPAWKSNKIHKGDILLKISTADRKTDDLSCMHADQVQEMINSGASAWAEMELIKSDGHVEKVKILREKMRVEDNNVNSCILNGKIKAGYISLPDFYTSPDMKDARGCANDVAKEILKLQRSGIEGLILDLRYNGGGSIEEAIDLAGIFIDAGPLAFMKFRNAKPVVLKDMIRGMVFGG